MPIYNPNSNQQKQQQNLWSAQVFKGKRKRPNSSGKLIYGEDLNQLLRVEPMSDRVRKIIQNSYPDAQIDNNGDILLSELRIFMATADPDKTFESWMQKFSTTGLEIRCDRHTILEKSEQMLDRYGNPRNHMKPCGEVCPMRDDPIGVDCTLGCTHSGRLTFYIYDLFLEGIEKPCYLDTHSWEDIQSIPTQLELVLNRHGSIKTAMCPTFRNQIVFVLSRSQVDIKRPMTDKNKTYTIPGTGQIKQSRTGKKTDDKTWALSLDLYPQWVQDFDAWNMAQEVKKLGYAPSPRLLESTGVIDVTSRSVPMAALAPSTEDGTIEQMMTEPAKEQLQQLLKEAGWAARPECFVQLIKERFGVERFGLVPFSRVADLYAIAANAQLARTYKTPAPVAKIVETEPDF
jgi:hypothetical protein